MENTINAIKLIIASIGAFLSAKLGILYPVLGIFVVCTILDQITGYSASKFEAKLGIGNGISSKRNIQGVAKKFGYICYIAVAMIVDWVIFNIANQLGIQVAGATFFGLLVTLWLILNELLSITENILRLGVKCPPFLRDVLTVMINKTEKIGNNQAALGEQGENKNE